MMDRIRRGARLRRRASACAPRRTAVVEERPMPAIPSLLTLALVAVPSLRGEGGDAFRPLGVNAKGTLVFERPRDHARVLWIPEGAFLQNGYSRVATDAPEQRATHVAGFAIDEAEVTARQFADFLAATGSDVDAQGRRLVVPVESGLEKVDGRWRPKPGCDELPVVGTTGWGALAFARWVGGDLPQLAEWQRAAGGVDGSIFPWGPEQPDATRANFRRYGPGMPTPVRSYPAGTSPCGAFDMAGNVYERVYPEGRPGALPVMIRGGCWASPHPLNLRTFDLCMQGMDVAERTVGFRCVVRSGAGLPVAPPERLRLAHSWQEAKSEALERNVPILHSLQFDTCGQCDRTKVGLFMDPEFIRCCNEHCVLAVGQAPGDSGGAPHPCGADGQCSVFPQITCLEHLDLFDEGLKRVEAFIVSPGNFLLDPRVPDEEHDPAKRILIDETELPKWGGGTDVYVAKIAEAQAKLGAPVDRAEWQRRKKGL
jgi:formylglycine-generating enzyme required for sulfatase activity